MPDLALFPAHFSLCEWEFPSEKRGKLFRGRANKAHLPKAELTCHAGEPEKDSLEQGWVGKAPWEKRLPHQNQDPRSLMSCQKDTMSIFTSCFWPIFRVIIGSDR